MLLHHRTTGDGPRLVLVHGFTQTGASWNAVVRDLSADHEVVVVDAPGHGGSATLELDLGAGAAALAATGGEAIYVGYSMGARLSLRLALDAPDLVSGLVLVGATAGIDDPGARAARRASDEVLATQIETDGVEAFLAHWLALPLFAGVPDDAAERTARATNTAPGLASSLRLAGTGAMDPPWWDALADLTMPVLAIAGADDPKFAALADRLATAIGANAATTLIEGSGHAVPLEQPARLAEAVRTFAAAIRPRPPTRS